MGDEQDVLKLRGYGVNARKTAWAPKAMALIMSLPVRMPESNRTVSFLDFWAAMMVDDWQIKSRARSEGMAPSTCLPPEETGQMKVRRNRKINCSRP